MGMILYYLTKMNMKIHTIKTIPELLEDCDILYWKHNRCSTLEEDINKNTKE